MWIRLTECSTPGILCQTWGIPFSRWNQSSLKTGIRTVISSQRYREQRESMKGIRGIDPKVLELSRRPGHWGLPGISERAKQIGARLHIWSEA